MKEQISALMDGEVDHKEMQEYIRELRIDPECRDCWQKYHLIGDALRNNLPQHLDRMFVSKISQAIANEDLPTPVNPPVSHQPKDKRRHAIANPLTGFALAASVAAVAYLGVSMLTVEEQVSGPRVASTSSIAPAPVAQLAQTAPSSDIRTVQGQQWNAHQKAAIESRLNNYLNSHRNVAGSTAMTPVVVPYARLVVTQPPSGE